MSLYIKPNKTSVLTVQRNIKNGKNIKSEKNCVRQIREGFLMKSYITCKFDTEMAYMGTD